MNKVILIGNLTRDPELRTTTNGYSVCKFGLAVNRRRKVEGQPDVDFFNINVWRQLGELCAKYLSKGRKVCVIGSIQVRTYEGKDGVTRASADVDAEDVEFLSSGAQGGDFRPADASATPAAPSAQAPAESGFTHVDEDDLPF